MSFKDLTPTAPTASDIVDLVPCSCRMIELIWIRTSDDKECLSQRRMRSVSEEFWWDVAIGKSFITRIRCDLMGHQYYWIAASKITYVECISWGDIVAQKRECLTPWHHWCAYLGGLGTIRNDGSLWWELETRGRKQIIKIQQNPPFYITTAGQIWRRRSKEWQIMTKISTSSKTQQMW